MNIQDFKKTLPTLLKNNIVPFVHGVQGIGKTQVHKQVAEELSRKEGVPYGFVHLHPATQDVGDLVGLLIKVYADGTPVTDNSTGPLPVAVVHACPEWFPTQAAVESGRFPANGLIFIDELNRAHPDVIQAMFSFITDKTIHKHKLAKGWKISAAGNRGEQFTVTDDSDAAWMSRFCHIELNPTVAEFAAYAESQGLDTVASFIPEHPQMLETKPKAEAAIFVTPDRRSWVEMIGPLENEDMEEQARFEVYSGIIGTVATTAFFAWKKTAERAIKLKDILKDYNKVRAQVQDAHKEGKDTRFDLLSAPIDELTTKLELNPSLLTGECVPNLQQYLLDIPLELLSKAVKKLGGLSFDNKDALLNAKEFNDRLARKAA